MPRKLTKDERETLRLKYDGRCAYCGCELPSRWHADHFQAVQRKSIVKDGRLVASGAMHKPEHDTLKNFMPSCAPCNLSKHSMSLEGWRSWLAGHVASLNAHHNIYRLAKAYGLVAETGNPVIFYFEKMAMNASIVEEPPAP